MGGWGEERQREGGGEGACGVWREMAVCGEEGEQRNWAWPWGTLHFLQTMTTNSSVVVPDPLVDVPAVCNDPLVGVLTVHHNPLVGVPAVPHDPPVDVLTLRHDHWRDLRWS